MSLSRWSTSRRRTDFFSVAEFYFHAPETRRYAAELWVDRGSKVDLLVHSLVLDDVMAGVQRQPWKRRRSLVSDGETAHLRASCSADERAAVAGIPMTGSGNLWLSSGTWSIMGIEAREAISSEAALAHGFGNELGVNGSVRFLKNILVIQYFLQTTAQANRPQRWLPPLNPVKSCFLKTSGSIPRRKENPFFPKRQQTRRKKLPKPN